ncbi:MAG: hypothetical protein WC755_05780 [Candidatus Woesearchaeota archaeon]|jgi:hypothetical protein
MKKSTTIVILITIFVLCIFISGCASSKNGNSKSQFGKNSGQGLTLTFDDQTSSIIYDNSPVNVEVLLKNEGYYDIPRGKAMIKLGGYDPTLFSFEALQRISTILEGKNDNSFGYSDYVSFGESRLKEGFLGENLPEISPTFTATICYPYKTFASAEVCINPDIYGKDSKMGRCSAGSAKIYNSNAPITVNSVQERFLSYDSGSGKVNVKFDITISNIGKNKIWSAANENYMYECGKYNSNLKEIQNKINIVSVKLTDTKLECKTASNNEVAQLIGNSVTFSCYGDILANDAFTTTLNIELEYGNSNYISKKVTIKSYKYSN